MSRFAVSARGWTDEALAWLDEHWIADLLSTKELGAELGCSKNAVVGKAHRRGLPPKESPIRNGGAPRVYPKQRKPKEKKAPPPLVVIAMPAPVILPPPQPKSLADVRGEPGVWQAPVGLPWPAILHIAAQSRFDFQGRNSLPLFNRSRVERGLPPLAIARGRQ
jgi:hypothetical protein